MDISDFYAIIDDVSKELNLNFSSKAMSLLAMAEHMSVDQIKAVSTVFTALKENKRSRVIDTLLKMSRLPLKNPKTFEEYDFSLIRSKNPDVLVALKNLPSLAEVYSRTNLAFIGPTGVGKTHLAQAYGRACCEAGLKTYFLKANELNEKFNNARKYGHEDACKNSLIKPTCLIIDEIGKNLFDQGNTKMFFDVIDRRYEKEGPQITILTSNVQPSDWHKYFTGDDELECALDRLFDKAEIFTIKGMSYRGRQRKTFSAETCSELSK